LNGTLHAALRLHVGVAVHLALERDQRRVGGFGGLALQNVATRARLCSRDLPKTPLLA
jgi:hypothetical protein